MGAGGGFDIKEASDLLSADLILFQCPPDLVIVDLLMPPFSGPETVVAALNSIRRARLEIPLVIVSGSDHAQKVADQFRLPLVHKDSLGGLADLARELTSL